MRLALEKMREGQVETSWQDSFVRGAPSDTLPSDPDWAGHKVYSVVEVKDTDARPGDLWRVIEGIGGENGWYSFPLAWAVRGWMDKAVGGVGLRRGRRNPDHLHTGDALDFWRVEQISRGSFLRLRAEMKLPGRAWLELSASPSGAGSRFTLRAIFFPTGLSGRLYWYAVLPFHGIIFAGMANYIVENAQTEKSAVGSESTTDA